VSSGHAGEAAPAPSRRRVGAQRAVRAVWRGTEARRGVAHRRKGRRGGASRAESDRQTVALKRPLQNSRRRNRRHQGTVHVHHHHHHATTTTSPRLSVGASPPQHSGLLIASILCGRQEQDAHRGRRRVLRGRAALLPPRWRRLNGSRDRLHVDLFNLRGSPPCLATTCHLSLFHRIREAPPERDLYLSLSHGPRRSSRVPKMMSRMLRMQTRRSTHATSLLGHKAVTSQFRSLGAGTAQRYANRPPTYPRFNRTQAAQLRPHTLRASAAQSRIRASPST
jgi:hypothetical protein